MACLRPQFSTFLVSSCVSFFRSTILTLRSLTIDDPTGALCIRLKFFGVYQGMCICTDMHWDEEPEGPKKQHCTGLGLGFRV